VKGRVKISLGGQCLPRGCEVYASAPDYSGLEDKWVEFYNNGALSFSFIPSLGVAYYNTSFDDETDNNGIAWGMDFFATYDIRHVQLAGSYRFTTGDDFVVKEAIPLKLSYYLGNRGDFLPSFSVAAKWSALHSTTGDFDFEKKQWGGEAGIAIDGPFERLSYSYCNALGGYHKFGLTLHRIRIGSWTMGTQYEYYRFDNTDMFRITGSFAEGSNFATGLGIGHGATDLQWHNDRPWWYKGVSYAGVLILPAAAIAGIIYIFGGGLID
jgi:hypothetical protein